MRRRSSSLLAGIVLTIAGTAALQAQSTGTITGSVRSADGRPLVGAAIIVVGTNVGVATRADGTYRIPARAGAQQLMVSMIGYASATADVNVTAGQTVTRDFTMNEAALVMSALVTLGTRRVNRTVADAPVPVDVLSADDIVKTGLVETNQVIQRLAPSFNFPRPSVNDGTDHIRPATLRGLAPDQVLVLVNGKRRHTSALVNVNGSIGRGSAAVDLNSIPVSAIERIEILRDGASAQYGSDAIAGVINIVLKAGTERSVLSTFGQTAEGDGTLLHFAGGAGLPIGTGGALTLSGEFRDREDTNRSLPDRRPQYFPNDPRNNDPNLSNQVNHRLGDADTRDISGFANLNLPFSNGAQLYGFGGLAVREGDAAGFWRRANDNRTVRSIHPNGFLPLINSDILDASGAIGLKGELKGWKLDLSGVLGRNSFDYNISNTNNASMGNASPTQFYAGTLIFNQGSVNFDVVKSLSLGLPAAVNVAAGGEYRRDNYQLLAGDEDSYKDGGVRVLDGPSAGAQTAPGAQVFPGFRPVDETNSSRNNVAGYLDLETNLHERFTLGLAGRAENYSDFGSTVTGKVSARLGLANWFAVRGAYNTGFKAPSLPQAYFSSTATNFIVVNGVNTPFEIRTFPVASAEARALGARDLEPETSKNLSGGIVFTPARDFSLTVDYYSIDIDDRIVLSGNFIGNDVRALLESRGFRGVGGGRYFTNAVDTETEGVDVVAYYGLDVGSLGVLRLTGAYNATETKVVRVAPNPTTLASQNEVLFDRVERARLEKGQPRNTVALTANLTRDAIALNVHNQRFGSVWSYGLATDGSADQEFGAKWITDMDVSYRFMNRITASIGANNVFDVYPDKWKDTDTQPIGGPLSNSGIFPYSGISPFGFNGAFYYARLNIKL